MYSYQKDGMIEEEGNISIDLDSQRAEEDDMSTVFETLYKQDLHRGLGAFMNFAFGFTEVAVIACISAIYSYGLTTGISIFKP